MSKNSVAALRGLLLASAVAGCAPSAAIAAERLTFLTDWFAQAEQGGFCEAEAEKLNEAAGLEVDVRSTLEERPEVVRTLIRGWRDKVRDSASGDAPIKSDNPNVATHESRVASRG